jgi:hypothetical protein
MSLDMADPLLGRDASYYLFHLPWQRVLHTFATTLVVVMALVVGALYVAVGAVRRQGRRMQITGLARMHLGALLVMLALALFWGYRLEPAEYVAGIHGVPFDVILTRVRVPVARLLSALALAAAASSLLWIWLERAILPIAMWSVLAGASIVGHYIAPAFAAAVRAPEEVAFADDAGMRADFERVAYGLPRSVTAATEWMPGGPLPDWDRATIWDGFAVSVALDRANPVYLATRALDHEAAQRTRDLTWEEVHRGALRAASGVFAVAADRSSAVGLPLFIPEPARPDVTTELVTEVGLGQARMWFAPGVRDFAVVEPADGVRHAVTVTGLAGRLAMAWVLQSARLLSTSSVPTGSSVLWERDVTSRMERYAPFARFGLAYPVVAGDALYWVATGYVSAEGFPGTRGVEWRGEGVRYLRGGLVGVVAAGSGETAVYLTEDADPLSRAWASLLPESVRPVGDVPSELRDHLRYPAELLTVQRGLLAPVGGSPSRIERDPLVLREVGRPDAPAWWLGTSPSDSVERLRRFAIVEGEGGAVRWFLDGTMRDVRPVLEVVDFSAWFEGTGPTRAARRLAAADSGTREIVGPVRSIPTASGLVHVRTVYESAEAPAAPAVRGVRAAWAGLDFAGATLGSIARDLEAAGPPDAAGARWDEARRWFERMDAARRGGDWGAFGEAYEALRRLMGSVLDSVP